jgi:hypothetical protein
MQRRADTLRAVDGKMQHFAALVTEVGVGSQKGDRILA